MGTAIVLETDSGKPWQQWDLKKNEDGTYCLVPRHAPDKGLDHLGGKPIAGGQDRPVDEQSRRSASGMDHQAPRRHDAGPVAPAPVSRHPSTYVPPRNQTGRHSQRRAEGIHVRQQHDFPGHRAAGDGLHPGPIRRLQPACVYVKTDGFNPNEKLAAGDVDRHQRDARDDRRVRQARGLAGAR